MTTTRLLVAVFLACPYLVAGTIFAAEPPVGFTPLFNGKDLAGWRGRPHFDPVKEAEGTDQERADRQAKWNADMAAHWKVEDGVIVNDGHGVFLTTDRDYADFELHLEWMFPEPVAIAASTSVATHRCSYGILPANATSSMAAKRVPAASGTTPLVPKERIRS